tara:strand:- start:723 stop:1049 length:327 start_codon:yes stop_codon:yes gene_type:complete
VTLNSVTTIGKAVAADAKSRQSSGIERTLAARMRGAVESEADQLLTTGCMPAEEAVSLTRERFSEMANRLGLRDKPTNPFPPSHPMHGAWEIAERRRRDWSMSGYPAR